MRATDRDSLQAPHIESFNYFLREAIHTAVDDIPEYEMNIGDTEVRWGIEQVKIGLPTKTSPVEKPLLPRECRERGLVYAAPFLGTFYYELGPSQGVSRVSLASRVPSQTVGVLRWCGGQMLALAILSRACDL